MTDIAVQIRGLRKVYRSGFFRRKFVGLEGLDLDIHRGECFGYIGPNGAGKTTTIKLLMGLNFPTSGTATVLGEPIGSLKALAKIGFLPERPYFYDYLTASEFLHFYGNLHGIDRATRERKIDQLLPLVHMERARDIQLRKFSKGMLQRVGVAQALINDPELVIFDEPSSGLDPMGRMLIRDIILGLKRDGVTILLSSHILSDVEQVCDRVALLNHGVVQQVARVDELVGQEIQAVELVFDRMPSATALALEHGKPLAQAGDRVTFEVADQDIANALVREALASGAQLVSMEPRRESLEQLFVDEMTAVDRAKREAAG
ncbi:MAG: ABC transporter ATP-binding protein [Myxococcota bacterium]|nr:ABC transporter ATP-binding protein [Myxococcota bacterium]